MGNLKKAIITATIEELRDEGLFPQFCQPGMKILIEETPEDCEFYFYYVKRDRKAGTIRKNLVEIGGR